MKNPHSFIVAFKSPPQYLIEKWQLATQSYADPGNYGRFRETRWSHMVVMPHVNKEIIREFIADLRNVRAAVMKELSA